MIRYIIRRLLQAIPLLFLISVIIFLLVQNAADPLESMSGRRQTRSEDRERLRRQLGLDKPLTVQYIYWLIGNDWDKTDLDGDGIPETYLFSLGLDRVAELDRGEISAGLREQFQSSGQALGESARVAVGQVGSSWTLAEGNREYYVRRENQTLIVYAEMYLFAMEANLAADLDAGKVSDRLRAQFQAHEQVLTRAGRVEVEQRGNRWLVFEADRKFYVRKEGQSLAVYAEPPGYRQGVLRGDFGRSLKTVKGESVLAVIASRLPNTLVLMGTAEVVILLFALLVGVYSALRQYSVLDQVMTALSFIGYSMPIFFIALLVLYLFSVNFRRWGLPYLPSSAVVPPPATSPAIVPFLVLPVISLSFTSLAGYSRYVRGTMLEVLNQDYIRTARSKGLPQRTVVFVHALKNASLPLVTLIGLDLPLLLGGAVVTERIFAWPGMGRLFLEGIQDGDTPLLMGIMMLISVAVVVFQLLTDLAYAWLDPRIRYQ